jgi:hypothetical protein
MPGVGHLFKQANNRRQQIERNAALAKQMALEFQAEKEEFL